jgi:betaine-aldehyde dehydrogenase
VDGAVRGMNFTWQGQSCGSMSRVLVHQDVYAEFVERLVTSVTSLRSGMPDDEETETGAIVNKGQYEKVLRYVQTGKDEGARLACGGSAPAAAELSEGLFIRPTVFADVDPGSRLAQEEIFGPVMAVVPFRDYDEAVRIANGVGYGLTAAVFTSDLRLAHRFACDVEAGYVWVNDVSRHWLGTSFGGVKNSGVGREEDLEELGSYTQAKNVHVNYGVRVP